MPAPRHDVPGRLQRPNPHEPRVAGRRVVWVFLVVGALLVALATILMLKMRPA